MKKTRELGIFAIGIGIIIAALGAWMAFVYGRMPNRTLALSFTTGTGVIAVVLGALTLSTKSRILVRTTVVFLVAGLVFDSLFDFNLVKLMISAGIIYLVLETGRLALAEDAPEEAQSSRVRNAAEQPSD